MDINKYIVQKNTSIINVIDIINNNSRGIAFVCENKKLLASVSDGDIRRYLLNKNDLSEPISSIAQYHPYYLNVNESYNAISFMEEKGILVLPIVDNNMEIKDIKFLIKRKDLLKYELNIPLVIMAGGKGMRLRPYTDILPKPLIPLGDKTITEHIMERFEQYGCLSIYMIVNYKKNFIKAYFLDMQIDQKVEFLEENEYWGTGGGLILLTGKITETFFLTNCDILVDANYADILAYHKKNHNIITMVCAEKEISVPYGTVEISEEGQAVRLQEKPSFLFNTNTGLYVIEPEFIDRIPSNTFVHITDVIQDCINQKEKVGVYLIPEESWMDMGQIEELEKMKEKLGLM